VDAGALALPTQCTSPQPVNFSTDPTQLRLAVVQAEILVEPLKHRPQVTLLITSPPVDVPMQPCPGTSKELAATLHARDSNYSKPSTAVRPTHVLEAEKLERLRPLAVSHPSFGGEAAKE